MGGVNIDDVEAGSLRTQGGLAVPTAKFTNVLEVHCARLDRIIVVVEVRQRRGPKGGFAAQPVAGRKPVVHQFHPGQGAMAFDAFRDQRHGWDIAVVHQFRTGVGPRVGSGVKHALFGTHDGPPALGLGFAHSRLGARVGDPHSVTVRHLIKTIAGSQRTDLYRLEQYVVA